MAVTRKHNPKMEEWCKRNELIFWLTTKVNANWEQRTHKRSWMNRLMPTESFDKQLQRTKFKETWMNVPSALASFATVKQSSLHTHTAGSQTRNPHCSKQTPFHMWTDKCTFAINLYLVRAHALGTAEEWGYTGCTVWNYSTTRLSVFQVCSVRARSIRTTSALHVPYSEFLYVLLEAANRPAFFFRT